MSNIILKDDNEIKDHFIGVYICVVTALQIELDAIIGMASSRDSIFAAQRTYHKMQFQINKKEFSIMGYTCDNVGVSSMIISLMEVIQILPQLRYIGVIGIAAGTNSVTQNFGDILIPKAVFNYEMGKFIENNSGGIEFKSDYSSYPIDEDVLQKILPIVRDEETLLSISKYCNKNTDQLSVHTGSFASGSAVIASQKKVEEIGLAISRKCIGFDMEAFAIAAVNQFKYLNHLKLFIVKSISDFADKEKNDLHQNMARKISARAFLEVCDRVLISNPDNKGELNNDIVLSIASMESNNHATDFEKYKALAETFDKIKIPELEERIEKKNKIGNQLGNMIITVSLNKSDILKLYSEGAIVGLMSSILLNPEKSDKKFIYETYDRVYAPFSQHKVLDVISEFLRRSFFEKKDFKQLRKIIDFYSFESDNELNKKLNKVSLLIDKIDIVNSYSVIKNNLKVDENVNVAKGTPTICFCEIQNFKKALCITGSFHNDAVDIELDTLGQDVSELSYTYWGIKEFILYANVKCINSLGEQPDLWIAFKTEIFDISKIPHQNEKAFPVTAKILSNGLKEVSVDLKNCVNQLFGEEEIKYKSIVKMRARGTGAIGSITLR